VLQEKTPLLAATELRHHRHIPHHSRTASAMSVSHPESELNRLEFDSQSEGVMTGDDERQLENDLIMQLLLDEEPPSIPRVAVVNHVEEHVATGDDERQLENALIMHLLLDEEPKSTTTSVVVVNDVEEHVMTRDDERQLENALIMQLLDEEPPSIPIVVVVKDVEEPVIARDDERQLENALIMHLLLDEEPPPIPRVVVVNDVEEDVMTGDDERQRENALIMHLLLDEEEPPSIPKVVVVHDDDISIDTEERQWGGVDVLSVSTNSSFEQYNLSLRDADVVCSRGIYTKADHPGNVRMRRIIAEYVMKWGRATTSEQLDLLVLIETEISWGFQHPRFLFTGMRREDDIVCCREASAEEIEKEIKEELCVHFKIIPKDHDYIFGIGKPIYFWPGNVQYREYMSRRIPKYQRQDGIGKGVIIKDVKKYVAHQGGRFLYPFDNANPMSGCVEVEDDRDVDEKIKCILRVSKGGLAGRRGRSPPRRPSSEWSLPEGIHPHYGTPFMSQVQQLGIHI
jgi:hypothetical protein